MVKDIVPVMALAHENMHQTEVHESRNGN